MNWLERARREIQKSARRPTAITVERTLTAVTAVPRPALYGKVGAPIGNNGSAPTQLATRTGDAREDFEERAAIMEYDGGLSRDEAEREAWALVLKKQH